MTKLLIETMEREDGYIALCCPENALWREASVGGGVTERSAVSEAINAYFQRQTLNSEVIMPAAPEPTAYVAPYKRVESADNVRALLNRVIHTQGQCGLEYGDYENRVTSRIIQPIKIDGGEFSWSPSKLVARDIEKDEIRHFRLDRVKAVWDV